jgi:hypothetical protein
MIGPRRRWPDLACNRFSAVESSSATSRGAAMIEPMALPLVRSLLMLGFASTAFAEPMTANEIAQIEGKIIENRRAIERCEVEIKFRYSDVAGKPLPERDYDVHYWFNGSQVRIDQIHEPSLDSRTRSIDCWQAEQAGLQFTFHPYKSNGARVAADFRHITEKDERTRKPSDPRSLGLIPFPLLNCQDMALDTAVGRSARTNLIGERVGEAGKEITTIQYEMNASTRCRAVIRRTGRGPVVERIEWISPGSPGQPAKLQYVLESKYDQARPEHRTLPSSFTYTAYQRGNFLERHEGIVNVISMNSTIEPKKFTLKGFELPEKTVILRVPPDGRSVVTTPDGLRTYDPERDNLADAPTGTSRWGGWRLRLGLIACTLIMLGGGALYFFRRFRRPKKTPPLQVQGSRTGEIGDKPLTA